REAGPGKSSVALYNPWFARFSESRVLTRLKFETMIFYRRSRRYSFTTRPHGKPNWGNGG
ncbi:MAG: hypothetical protein M0Z96_04040, partial [Actinomycetota bacterium]|nr:hypothetical protein [Actinomycetota bacterium]